MIGYYRSSFGFIRYDYQKHIISSMSFIDEVPNEAVYEPAINNALDGYFRGKKRKFDFAYKFDGFTSFQIDVFNAMLNIPYGQTKSYKDIAVSIDRPKAYRAVGQACKRNPIGIMVPCHRVIGSDQSLTGYSGKKMIHLKAKLLELERKYSSF